MLASEFLLSFVLYYDVSNNVYVMNDLSAATVFKKKCRSLRLSSRLLTNLIVLRARIEMREQGSRLRRDTGSSAWQCDTKGAAARPK